MPIIPSTPKLSRFGLVQDDAVLGSSKTTPFWAKRHSFANLRIFFFLKKKKKEIEKKEEIGVAGATLCPKNGVVGPPHFWPKGGRPPYTGRMGVAEATPGLWGWSGHPERPKKKKKKRKNGVWPLGVAGPPPRAWGWLRPPLRLVDGVRSHPQALGGGPAIPKGQNPFFRFFFFWPFEVVGPPPKAWGGFSHPHTAGMGWLGTPWPKMGWSGHPIFWARGGSSHPDFFLSSFFFFFLISFFFSKKKKKKTKTKT
jgi:hypothetical protein